MKKLLGSAALAAALAFGLGGVAGAQTGTQPSPMGTPGQTGAPTAPGAAVGGGVGVAGMMNEQQVRDMLRQRGYSEIEDIERDGDRFTARAKRGGEQVRLQVDARTGIVQERQGGTGSN